MGRLIAVLQKGVQVLRCGVGVYKTIKWTVDGNAANVRFLG